MAKSAVGKKLVIVESPTKARTIRKFLSKDFVVESCMGHVRDLPQSAKAIPEKYKKEKWASLGVNVDKKFEPIYCIPKNKTKIVTTLKKLLKEADELILATDEDREGESISWHLLELLKPKVPVKRMVFHEITKEAIGSALEQFRELDYNLVRAQEARRILDRLVGYTISPLIWKKVAYGLSAGRVQSVAVNLISEKELERKKFKINSYCGLLGHCKKGDKESGKFDGKLVSYGDKKVAMGKDFDGDIGGLLESKKATTIHLDEKKSQEILEEVSKKSWKVKSVEERPLSRKPAPPFITSTLQQDANRKLGMGSKEAMQVAQKLYEQGFITYMRTDSTNLSEQALSAARSCIDKMYGKDYLPAEARTYNKKKVKGAQEAHEAIRPAGTEFVLPEESGLSGPALKLYDLIWKRTVGSQMVNSRQKQVQVRIEAGDALFAASGMTIEFPGFLRAYVEGSDDAEATLDDKEVHLPKMVVGDEIKCSGLEVTKHETKPPARFTEASLVQTMEKEGIGRPSTYASIIGTIIDRGYVKKIGTALVPSFTALVVAKLLRENLPSYVDVGFTSGMEHSLDDVAEGELDSIKYLDSIYFGKEGLQAQVSAKEESIDADQARSLQMEGLEGIDIRVGRYGAYICRMEEDGEEVCASLPESQVPADMSLEVAHKLIDQKLKGGDSLGKHPDSDERVLLLNGRYGPYVQLGEIDEDVKPKRASIPPSINPDEITLDEAVQLLSLPKTLGEHPETEKPVKAGLGRFGPYIVHDGDFRSVPKDENLFEVTFERAMELLAQPKKGRGRATPLKELGKHPSSDDEMQVMNGKYGPYVKCGKVNVSLPEDMKPEDMTKEKAVELLGDKVTAKSSASKKKKTKKKAKKKAVKKKVGKKVAKKSTTKKATTKKKTAAKKTAKKKVVLKKASEKRATS